MSTYKPSQSEQLLERLLLEEQDHEAFLEELCSEHPDLAEELRARVALIDGMRQRLRAVAPVMPESVGRFQVRELLGRGGMGVVYRAHDPELDREVAVKVLRLGWLGDERRRARFMREIRVAARLHHPGLLTVFEVGSENGEVFYATELVEGSNLAQLIQGLAERGESAAELSSQSWSEVRGTASDARKKGSGSSGLEQDNLRCNGHPGQSARIALAIAQALQHAHAQGVVHRDVKPANVMLARDGRVLLVDFGLAEVATEDSLTGTQDFLGTPYYAPPERINGSAEEDDPRSDIYSLGVSLYELLCLTKPFTGKTRDQIFQQILNEEPIPPRRLNSEVPLDLETIVLKSLEKDPRHRYSSAAALAEDLERFLSNLPIRARRSGLFERLVKWSRRKPVVAGLAAGLLLALTTIVVGTLLYADRLHHFADTLMEREARAASNLYRADMASAAMAVDRNDWRSVERLLEAHADPGAGRDLRGYEWRYMWRSGHSGVTFVEPPESRLAVVAVSPDGSRFATGHGTGRVLLWDLAEFEVLASFEEHSAPVNALEFSPDGRWLASAGDDRSAVLVDLEGEFSPRRLGPHVECVQAMKFSPSGERLVVCAGRWDSNVGEVRTWRTLDGTQETEPYRRAHLQALCFVTEETVLLTCLDRKLVLWDCAAGQVMRVHEAPRFPVSSLAGGGGRGLVSLGVDRAGGGELLFWDASGTSLTARMTIHSPACVAVSPDGQLVAVGQSGRITLVDSATTRVRCVLRGHSSVVIDLDFTPDGSNLISMASNGRIGVWDLGAARPPEELDFRVVKSVALDQQGERLAGSSNLGDVVVWDLDSGQRLLELPASGRNAIVRLSRDGRRIFVGSAANDRFESWDVDTALLRWSVEAVGTRESLALGPDDRLLAVSGLGDGASGAQLLLLDTESGELALRLQTNGAGMGQLAFGPQGMLAAAERNSGRVLLYESGSSSPTRQISLRDGIVNGMAFDRSGERLCCSIGANILVLEVATGKVEASLALTPEATSVAFIDDDRRLVVCSRGGRVSFWDTQSWAEVASFQAHREYFEGLAVSGDGTVMATGAFDGKVRLWRQ